MEQIGILCSELFSEYNANIKKSIAETGLSLIQAKVLFLARIFEDNKLSQKDMAKICRTDTPAMSRTIDKLEESGYIVRSRKSEDSRCVSIELSEEGIEKSNQVRSKFNDVNGSMFSELSDDDLNELKALLTKMAGQNEIFRKIHSDLLSDISSDN
ncbi:MAG: MarR family transcriptional regulator [Candidatus Metalachnospira sp.]|nr:MarR family transcriptional regulator [Candidatus Metalachnospira sp.]